MLVNFFNILFKKPSIFDCSASRLVLYKGVPVIFPFK